MNYELPQEAKDQIRAASLVAGHSGAREFQIGYLREDVPWWLAGWFVTASYRGARIMTDEHPDPGTAADAFARRLLNGGKCTHCGGLVTTNPDGEWARDSIHTDGTHWTAQEQIAAGLCYWQRIGAEWVRGCRKRTTRPEPQIIPVPNRSDRRRAVRAARRGRLR